MKYDKPEIVALASATDAIEMIDKGVVFTEGPFPELSINAYEADE